MMRNGKRRVRALGVLVLGCAVAWGPGCKKQEPAAVASLDAGVAPAAVAVAYATRALVRRSASRCGSRA